MGQIEEKHMGGDAFKEYPQEKEHADGNHRLQAAYVRMTTESPPWSGSDERDRTSTQQMTFGEAMQKASKHLLPKKENVQTKMQLESTERVREILRKSMRNIVFNDRKAGNSRSFALSPENMTESQFLLEALRKPDWPDRLQGQGVEINKPMLDSIDQQLKGIDPHQYWDYNTAVSNFREKSLDHIQSKELAVEQHVESAGLEGGGYHFYDDHRRRYYGRTMTLKDAQGDEHVFDKGQWEEDIADFTIQQIAEHRQQYVDQWIEYHRQEYAAASSTYYPTQENIQYYEGQYNKNHALELQDVSKLKKGKSINGWTCTELTLFPVQKTTYYTDKGAKIYAVDLSRYKPLSREEHNLRCPYPPIEDPTPMFNCHSVFIDKKGWLITDARGRQIQTILDHNKYTAYKDNQDAKIGDLVIYYAEDTSIRHTAIVISNNAGIVMVDSKPGIGGIIPPHNIYDPWAVQQYGNPLAFYTKRKGGNSLRTTPP